ncbi:MAG: glycosyltransferase family 4 protein [Rhodocyclaceae bacterium]|nr:glycosyltransferase family 4 protein [Rhodocyclaceae bacterium]
MKILLANKFFFRNGGSEVVMFQERDFLRREGHEVADFSMQDERNFASDYAPYFVGRQDYRGSGRLDKLKSALAFVHSPEAVRKIGALIEATRPDLVHCHNIYHQLTPSIIGAAKARGVPVALTLHDYKPVCPAYTRLRNGKPCSECLEGSFAPALRHRCAEGSLGKSALLYAEAVTQRRLGSYEKADRFIAPSRFMAESVARRFPADRIALLYNGVDTAGFPLGGRDEGYALYLGRLSREKGVETLLRAHDAARGAWPLMVAGTGPLLDVLMAQYKHATFAGHLTGHVLQEAIAGAAVVVVPSEWFENCPMSVLEAMAQGKPVVGSRMGGIPELVAEGETGLLFEAGNVVELGACLDRLMGDPALRRRMGQAARARAEREFSLERHNAGLMKIYNSLISESGSQKKNQVSLRSWKETILVR